ncbi:hypothetical protein [Streptomyces sp. NPDC005969]|uniref:MGDG synthase family glycosyltransferase n=1 Tax=Streptomyces sp. NPDC005969 TaxID=3156722 RepID=UPI0033FC4BF2
MGRRILIVSASMGAGHDAVAAELAGRLRAGGHLTARVDLLDILPPGVGRGLRAAYRTALRHCPGAYAAVYSAFFRDRGDQRDRNGWAPSTGPLAAALEPRLRDIVERWRPDGLVSTFHQAAQVTGRLRAQGGDCPPSTVVVTDFAVHRQWLHPGNDLHLCLTEGRGRSSDRRNSGGTDQRVMAQGPRLRAALPNGLHGGAGSLDRWGEPGSSCLWPVGVSGPLECQEVFGESGQLRCGGVNLGDERCDHHRCLVGGVANCSRSVHTERPSVARRMGEGSPFHSPSLLVFTVSA